MVTNPNTSLTATSLNAITAGAVPVWVTSTTLNASAIDTAFSQTISATDADGGSSITYAIISGAFPTGLSLNTSTGAITGTPSGSVGTYTVTISATDSGGNAVNRTFTQQLNANQALVEYLVVAGGGTGSTGGTYSAGAGGGAGGYRTNYQGTKLSFAGGVQYTITVGAGGSALSSNGLGNSGTNSSISGSGISTISATGGGGAGIEGFYGGYNGLYGVGKTGGSGGGSSNSSSQSAPGNAGGYSPVEGYRGGYGVNDNGGGGGGSSQAGQDAYGSGQSDGRGGYGGAGTANSITGSSVTYAGGGGGASYNGQGASGGAGGGTAGASYSGGSSNATQNSGGGSGGTANHGAVNTAGNGGSGIVVIRASKAAVS
ncbi:MAG: cadherin repeat domain-containing protein, partial [Cyclobacteriaceae bacterium]|nr:cadherin repeat domain-containing protein [Cyclobacteriaceae bacterium]